VARAIPVRASAEAGSFLIVGAIVGVVSGWSMADQAHDSGGESSSGAAGAILMRTAAEPLKRAAL
jgi:hypothetical protein